MNYPLVPVLWPGLASDEGKHVFTGFGECLRSGGSQEDAEWFHLMVMIREHSMRRPASGPPKSFGIPETISSGLLFAVQMVGRL